MTMLTKTELMKIPYSKLLKLELPRFANRVIGIVEKHNPEELKIIESFNLLVAEQPRIDVLIDKYGPHPQTEELVKLRKMRTLYISAIRFRLKVVIREDKSGRERDVKVVRNEVNHFFTNLKLSKNEEMFNQKVDDFFTAISQSEELGSALESLDFLENLENLQRVHTSIQSLIYKRLNSISARPSETTAELKKPVITATKNLIKHIEIAPFLNTDLDYSPLFRELNQLSIEYKNLINKRILFNKRKAEDIDNIEDVESTETTTTTQSAEPLVKMLHSNGEDVNLNGSGNELAEIEKAAAMSSKTMQLPIVENNEASEL